MPEVTSCECRFVVRARNVSALIVNGFMASGAAAENKNKQPLKYEVIDFCAKPTCERVFRAMKQEEIV